MMLTTRLFVKSVSVILAWICSLVAVAQPLKKFSFTHYSTATGSISNQVNSMLQDETGYIWMGTTDGLQRFDGIRYKNFRHRTNDPFSIPSNSILQILTDKKKKLWILTEDGRAGTFDTRTYVFRETLVKTGNQAALKSLLKKIVTDDAGNLFLILTGNELLTWDEKANEFSASHNFIPGKAELHISDFVPQPQSTKYWMSLQDGGLAIYDKASNQISYPGNNAGNETAISQFEKLTGITNLFFDSKGRLWFNTPGPGFPYTYCYDSKAKAFVLDRHELVSTVKTYYETHGFFEQSDGSVWIKGFKLFARYVEGKKRFDPVFSGEESDRDINYKLITSLSEDREHNIWIGTGNNGFFRFNPSEEFFTSIIHKSRATSLVGGGSPVSFMQDKDGSILVGTWGDGLYRYDPNFSEIPLSIKGIADKNNVSIRCMFASKDSNTIWMSSLPGLYAYDQKNRSVKYFNPAILQNITVREIAEDKNGNLWLGMRSTGLFKWDAAKGRKVFEEGMSKIMVVPPVQITRITFDNSGNVWVSTGSEGVYVIDPDTDKVLLHFGMKETGEKKLPEENVSAVFNYNDSLMVIATASRIMLYNKLLHTTTEVTTSETLSGNVSSIEKDRNGYLWVATTSALYRVNIRTRVFVQFNRNDGMSNDYFVLTSSRTLPDGRMIFGSTEEFILFDPGRIKISTAFPNVVITDFRVMNKSLRVDSILNLKQVELGPDENSLEIEFSSLSYSSAYLVKYKLEGLDKKWKFADKSNIAIYSYLPPGTYTLLLAAIDAEGNTIGMNRQLTITINPPIWKTWWFYSLLILLLGGLLFYIDRERMNKKAAIQKMRSDIAANLHADVNAALNNINILSEMARIKADKEPRKSKEFIEQIHNKSGHMIDAMEDMLWSISPENDSMQKTVERMQEYIEGLNKRHNSTIEMLVDEKVKTLNLNMQLRHEAFLLFKESINGLLKAGAGNCRIHVTIDKNILSYTVQFKNDGCDMQQLNHLLHRQDMAKRLETIKATLQVEVHKSNSVLMLKLPVGTL